MNFAAQEIVSKAFQLAYFIHPDRETALSITREAFSSLHKHLKPQGKRMYYRLRGRIVDGLTLKGRNKISLEQSQKLQLLIYLHSEKIEKQQEATFIAASSLDQPHQAIRNDDCIVRFLEHLISITVSRSAFYVALGLGRVAFNYSTAQTAAIYDIIHPDGQCKKDSPYFRKRKNEFLMKSLKERFGPFLRTHLVAHGEERFQARADSSSFMPLVNECLGMFTPWNTPCVLPERLDPMNKEIDQLRFNDADPDKEHPVEAQRMHSVIHPDCFSRIVMALALPAPEQRLQVPLFF